MLHKRSLRHGGARLCASTPLAALVLTALLAAGCGERLSPEALRQRNVGRDLEFQAARADPPPRPLTYDGAVRYALAHNLAVWAAEQERRFQEELATQARLDMLPSLMVNAEASRRSEVPAQQSKDLLTGRLTNEVSVSSEKTTRRLHASALWNLLDFGVGFLRNRQAADEVAAARMRLARARQSLVLKVTRRYWRAAAAQAVARHAEQVDQAILKLLGQVDTAREKGAISKVEALEREAPLLEYRVRLEGAREEARTAVAELAETLGVPPGAQIDLAAFPLNGPLPRLETPLKQLEAEALLKRPELREKDLAERISREEARVALAELFPSPAAFVRYDTDRNKYLYYNDWYSAGLRASWNLLAIPQRLAERRAARLRAELTAGERAALAVGILSQLHLAVIEYQSQERQHALIRTVAQKRAALAQAARDAAEQGKAHGGKVIEAEIRSFLARSRHLRTVANARTAYARVLHSVGRGWEPPGARGEAFPDDGIPELEEPEGAEPPEPSVDPDRVGAQAHPVVPVPQP